MALISRDILLVTSLALKDSMAGIRDLIFSGAVTATAKTDTGVQHRLPGNMRALQTWC